MQFAVIGSGGLFGAEIVARLSSLGYEVLGFNRENLDLSKNIEDLALSLRGADVIVNAVGYTAVDKAETEPEVANYVNGDLAGKLAMTAKEIRAKFMHISTDYLFDGKADKPYKLDAGVSPQTAYGFSKALGEKYVTESGANSTILRTSWLYGEYGNCFPKTISRLFSEQDEIDVVNDQVGAPTWARDLADVVIDHATNNFGEDIVHAVASGITTWFQFAEEIRRQLPNSQQKSVRGIPSAIRETAARRPAWSVLDNSATSGLVIGDWLERWNKASGRLIPNINESNT
jgi:dTDP-4-dehydrorhamnose reductase